MRRGRSLRAHGASPSPGRVGGLLTICVKYTPGFTSRRRKLRALLASLRLHHGAIEVLVATEAKVPSRLGAPYDAMLADGSVTRFVVLPPGAGLSAGRNALLREVRTEFAALMDDDLVLRNNRTLPLLLGALLHRADAAVAGGCHFDTQRQQRDCYNMRFEASEDGSFVRVRRAHVPHGGGRCARVHMTHNFFVARVSVLLRFGWDPRQRVMEHETFFYQLHLNAAAVLACPDAMAAHNTRTSKDDAYETRSLRATEGLKGRDPGNAFMQYLCKNLPQVRRFETPFTSWHCEAHRFCTPLWDAQFAHDGSHCAAFRWDPDDDASTVIRPLGDAPGREGRFPSAASPGSATAASSAPRHESPLLVLALTEPANVQRREWQRATWLTFRWHALSERDGRGRRRDSTGDQLVPWRYVYVVSAEPHAAGYSNGSAGSALPPALGDVVGDIVTLETLSHRRGALAEAAIRWAVANVDFEVVLLTDDQSLVHVGRVWEWLLTHTRAASLWLVAGRTAAAVDDATEHALPPWHSALMHRSSSSWLLGRSSCARVGRGNDEAAAAHANFSWRAGPVPGFRRAPRGKQWANDVTTSTKLFRGALLVDAVHQRPHERPFEAFRWLMQAEDLALYPAVWQRPGAFARADCAGCEMSYFPQTTGQVS